MSNHNEAYRAPNDGEVVKGSVANGHPAESSVCRRISICVLATLVVCLLIFPIITIPILFTMIRDKKTTTSPSTSVSVSSSYSTISSAATTSSVGGASMTSKGGVQAGGGTTIYKAVGTIPTSACPKYLSAAAVFDNKFIVSNADRSSGLGTVRVMQIDSSRKGTTLASNTSNSDMYQVATLNQGTGLFITISQGDGQYGLKKKSAIIAGKVNPAKGFAISLGSPISYVDDALFGSIAPSLTTLSNNSFAFTYYMNVTVYTRYGTVDPTTLKVTLSPAVVIADNSGYTTSMAIAAISATKYVVIYHDEETKTKSTLLATVVTGSEVSPGVLKAELATATPSKFQGYTISGTFKATTLTKSASGLSEVIIAYIDVDTRMGLTCTSLLVNPTTGSVIDGSSLSITTGASVAAYSSVSIVTIGTGSKFMVSFTNKVLQGSSMAAIGQSTKSELVRVSPNYVLNAGAAGRKGYATFVALAVSSATPHFSRVAILSSIADSSTITCANSVPVNDFSFMEVLPKPLGVMMTSGEVGTSQSTSVSMSGVASGFSGLVAGKTYYTTTSGKLVTDGSFYGMSDVQSSNSAVNGFFYVNDAVNNVIVGSDSVIGVAISSDSILLKSG